MAASKRKGRPKDGEIPWDEIERVYVQGEMVDGKRSLPSISDLARRWEVSRKSVSARASLGDWIDKRASFTTVLAQEVTKKVAEVTARHLADRVKRRAELGARVLDAVDAVLDGRVARGNIDPINLQRLQTVLKTAAETDRIDLALDPPETGGEKDDEEDEDGELNAAADALADELVRRNQSPGAETGAGGSEE